MKSWVESANSAETDFPLQNLPCGVFSLKDEEPRCGVAIGAMILDMAGLEAAGVISAGEDPVFDVPFWNDFMELGADAWAGFRAALTELLADGSDYRAEVEPFLVPMTAARLHMPFLVSEYTDFYASRDHAVNVGSMFRDPANALPPNWPTP